MKLLIKYMVIFCNYFCMKNTFNIFVGEIQIPAGYAISCGFVFVDVSAIIVHTIVYYGRIFVLFVIKKQDFFLYFYIDFKEYMKFPKNKDFILK